MNIKHLFIILLISLSFNSNADSLKEPVLTSDDSSIHKDNNDVVNDLYLSVTDLSDKVDKYKVCMDKEQVYIGEGATGADADGCYDVITETTNSAENLHPIFAGFLGADAVSFHTVLNPATFNASLLGRFNADIACNTQYPGSRAMVYEDLTYIAETLTTTTNIVKVPFWVYDAVSSIKNRTSNVYYTKYGGEDTDLTQCNAFSGTAVDTDKAVVLNTYTSGGGNIVMKFDTQLCSLAARIVCVSK